MKLRWDFQLMKLARMHGRNCGLNKLRRRLDATIIIGRKFQNGNLPASEILLVTNVLVGRDEQVEFVFRQPEQIAVLDPAPAALLGGGTFMAGKKFAHRPGDAFVQKNFHSATGVSSADSELSRTRQAIARVTDGKHSRNSSRV